MGDPVRVGDTVRVAFDDRADGTRVWRLATKRDRNALDAVVLIIDGGKASISCADARWSVTLGEIEAQQGKPASGGVVVDVDDEANKDEE